ncbi:MAG: hypothetical protein M1835_006641, partial [Candelina submexicana]
MTDLGSRDAAQRAPCGPKTVCIDHYSDVCRNNTLSQFLCCPSDAPYCLNSTSYGLGCYASSSSASPSSLSFSQADILHTESANPTSTLTLRLILVNSSLATIFPISPAPTSTGLEFSLPTAAGAEPSTTELVSSSTSSNTISSTSPSSSITARLTSYVAPTPSTTLCFNPSLATDLPCSSSYTTSKPLSSSSDNGFSPPGAKTINSKASRIESLTLFSWFLTWVCPFVAFYFWMETDLWMSERKIPGSQELQGAEIEEQS